MEESREYTRYHIDAGGRVPATVEIEGDVCFTGTITDLSAGGLSFIVENDRDYSSEPGKFFFIRLNLGGVSINTEVEKKWSYIKNSENGKIYSAGVSFKVISNEDRLRLNEIIECLRSGSFNHSRIS